MLNNIIMEFRVLKILDELCYETGSSLLACTWVLVESDAYDDCQVLKLPLSAFREIVMLPYYHTLPLKVLPCYGPQQLLCHGRL